MAPCLCHGDMMLQDAHSTMPVDDLLLCQSDDHTSMSENDQLQICTTVPLSLYPRVIPFCRGQ